MLDKPKTRVKPRATMRSNAEILAAELEAEEARIAAEEDSDLTIEAQIKSGVGIVHIRMAQVRTKLQRLATAKARLETIIEKNKVEFAALAAIVRLEKPLIPKILKRSGYPVGERKMDKTPTVNGKKPSTRQGLSSSEKETFQKLILSGRFDEASTMLKKVSKPKK